MAFLGVYLARTAQRGQQPTVPPTRSMLGRFGALMRAVAETWSEARTLRRELTHKHPFMDV